jgi:hypothetical protein
MKFKLGDKVYFIKYIKRTYYKPNKYYVSGHIISIKGKLITIQRKWWYHRPNDQNDKKKWTTGVFCRNVKDIEHYYKKLK